MNHFINGFADELVKIAVEKEPLWQSLSEEERARRQKLLPGMLTMLGTTVGGMALGFVPKGRAGLKAVNAARRRMGKPALSGKAMENTKFVSSELEPLVGAGLGLGVGIPAGAMADRLLNKEAGAGSSIAKAWKSLSPEARSVAKSVGLWSGLDYAMFPEAGLGAAVRGGLGYAGGEHLADKALKGRGGVKGFFGRAAGGMLGAALLESLAKKKEKKKPTSRVVESYRERMPRRSQSWPEGMPQLSGYGQDKWAADKSYLTPGSSNVRGFRYDPKTQQLFITYKGGGTYRYSGVPKAAFRSLRRNKSAGKTVNKLVKAKGYAYEKVAKSYKCKNCGAPATKGLIWAEGRAIATHCDNAKCRSITLKKIGEKPSEVRDLTKRAGFLRERIREGGGKTELIDELHRKRRSIEKKAGVAKKQVTWNGLTMKLEYLKGDERSGTNGATGKKWSRVMRDHYGYIPGTGGQGDDGEALDVYLSPEPLDGPVFVVHQKKKTGEHDEKKYLIGYGSSETARKAFLRNMPNWALGDMTSMSLKSFRTLVGQEGNKLRVPSDGNKERARVRARLEGATK